MRDKYQLAVITNDIYTQEDAKFLMCSQALEEERIIAFIEYQGMLAESVETQENAA